MTGLITLSSGSTHGSAASSAESSAKSVRYDGSWPTSLGICGGIASMTATRSVNAATKLSCRSSTRRMIASTMCWGGAMLPVRRAGNGWRSNVRFAATWASGSDPSILARRSGPAAGARAQDWAQGVEDGSAACFANGRGEPDEIYWSCEAV
jgi:hypothetical protein